VSSWVLEAEQEDADDADKEELREIPERLGRTRMETWACFFEGFV